MCPAHKTPHPHLTTCCDSLPTREASETGIIICQQSHHEDLTLVASARLRMLYLCSGLTGSVESLVSLRPPSKHWKFKKVILLVFDQCKVGDEEKCSRKFPPFLFLYGQYSSDTVVLYNFAKGILRGECQMCLLQSYGQLSGALSLWIS
jgi:hypothetical protein